jgi:hypothetical protein
MVAVCGRETTDIAAMLDDIAPMLDDIVSMLDDIAPMLDDIGLMYDDIVSMLDDIASMLDDIAAMLDDIAPMLDDIGAVSGDKPSGRDVRARGLPVRKIQRGGGDPRAIGPDIRAQRTSVRSGTSVAAVDARSSRDSRRVAVALLPGCR